METIDFNIAADRRNTNSVKWDRGAIESISANPDAEPFWVADMDFLPEPHIKAKAIEVAQHGIFGYTTDFPELRSIFCSWLIKRHQWSINPDNAVFTMGLLHGIALAVDLFTKEGDRILIPTPAYRPFRMLIEEAGRIVEEMPLHYEDGIFSLDYDSFKEHADKCSMIIFCSPHNPSGLVFKEEDLRLVLEYSKSLGIAVVSDEIHADLVHPSAHHIPMGKANESIGASCITFMAPSKTFNVAGEHSAFAVFSDDEMKGIFTKKQSALFVSHPGYLIGELSEAAYKEGLEYNEKLCAYLEENADTIRSYLKENCPEIRLTNGDASFVTFLDCSDIYEKVREKAEADPERYKGGSEGGILSRFFGVEAGVAMNDGTWFGDEYYAFVRFNYGTSRDRVLKALKGISEAVRSLK